MTRGSGGSEGPWNAHTRRPGESSVYSFSIVFDDPPAPAALVELGFATCEPAARRLVEEFVFLKKTKIRRLTYRVLAPGGLATADDRPL